MRRYTRGVKSLLDIGVALSFFGAYFLSDIYTATVVLIGALYAAALIHRLVWKQWNKAHVIGALVATVLGGLTLIVRDPDFIMLKPTAVYGIFALALAISTVVGERPLMQRLGQSLLKLPDAIWTRLTWAWAGFFLFCAALNLVLAWRLDEADWVTFKTFGFTALMFVFLIAHAPFLAPYLDDTSATEDEDAVHDSRP